jgi:hypothetical protein
MSVRLTSGTSWRGNRPGTRHWFSISYYLHFWELGIGGITLAAPVLLGLMILGELWLGAEALVIIASGILIIVNLCLGKRLGWRFTHWQRLPFALWAVVVPEMGEL